MGALNRADSDLLVQTNRNRHQFRIANHAPMWYVAQRIGSLVVWSQCFQDTQARVINDRHDLA